MTTWKNFRAHALKLAAVAAAVTALLLFSAAPAKADNDCGAFSVVLDNGVVLTGRQDLVIPAHLVGLSAHVRGTFVQFDVDLATFTVSNYTLTAASNVTYGQHKVIFVLKQPLLASPLTGSLTLQLKNEQIVLIRGGATNKIKIQAKDCSSGDLFEMEPDRAISFHHELAHAFRYFEDNHGEILFTDGITIGRESPKNATLSALMQKDSLWNVKDGGSMGALFGDDGTKD